MNQLSLSYLSQNPTEVLPIGEEEFIAPPSGAGGLILQFGTGVLLRGLPDYFVDKANKKGIFQGKIIVVKSTDGGDIHDFEAQDNLYTLCVRGIEDGKTIEENIVCSAISRVLSAKTQWQEILQYAKNPAMQIVISNTTEVGIQLVKENIHQNPPQSFPAKLLAFLYARYQAFEGDESKGMVIVPTELIPDNGKKLEAIVLELAYLNGLDTDFIDWIEKYNYFCNSLVDRIVPGKPEAKNLENLAEKLGYKDTLLIMSEVYRLWAIEGDEHIKNVLSFHQADEGIIIAPNIDIFRELKLRMLNGTHTLTCGLAHLAGFRTVGDAMQDEIMAEFIQNLMLSDIAKGIPYEIEETQIRQFGTKVLDRFRNPFIEHPWLNITLQYSSKMAMRNIPTLLNYYKKFDNVPEYFALGFAAYLLFMRVEKEENGVFYGSWKDKSYQIQDDKAKIIKELWQKYGNDEMVCVVLKSKELWGEDLSQLKDFSDKVQDFLNQVLNFGAKETISKLIQKSKNLIYQIQR